MPTINRPKKTNYNGERKKQRAKYYGLTQWKNLRQWYMMEHPLCEECLNEKIKNEDGTIEEKITPAVDVHHIISPFKFDDDLTIKQYLLDGDNLMSLCKWHHAQKHIRKSLS